MFSFSANLWKLRRKLGLGFFSLVACSAIFRIDLKAALDKIDQQYLNEIVGGQEPGEEDTQNDLKVHEENTTIEELEVTPLPPSLVPRHAFHSLRQMVGLLRLFSVQRAGVFGHYKGPSSVSCLVFIHSLFLVFYTHSPTSCLQKYSF